MRNYFKLDDKSQVVINPELLSLEAFRKLWDRDKSKSKDGAYRDFAFIYWMTDFRSYLSDITDNEQREKETIDLIDSTGKYKPDNLVKQAIEVYKKDLPISLLFLEDAKAGINALRTYYRNLEGDDLKHQDASKLQANYKTIGDLIDNLEKLESKVKKDLDSENSIRGGKSKGFFEDEIDD